MNHIGSSPETGAGSILTVALTAGCLGAMLLFAPLYKGIENRAVAQSAADASALAAADVLAGIISGVPCDRAAVTAAANGARLTGCRLDGQVATVAVSVGGGALSGRSTASAGPPGPTAD